MMGEYLIMIWIDFHKWVRELIVKQMQFYPLSQLCYGKGPIPETGIQRSGLDN